MLFVIVLFVYFWVKQWMKMFNAQERFEDTKVVIRICKSKDRQHKGQKKKGQTTIYKTLHKKLKIEQHQSH